MTKSGKGRLLFITTGVICLGSAAIMVWRRITDGLTMRGLLVPLAFVLIGVFWLILGLRTNGAKDT